MTLFISPSPPPPSLSLSLSLSVSPLPLLSERQVNYSYQSYSQKYHQLFGIPMVVKMRRQCTYRDLYAAIYQRYAHALSEWAGVDSSEKSELVILMYMKCGYSVHRSSDPRNVMHKSMHAPTLSVYEGDPHTQAHVQCSTHSFTTNGRNSAHNNTSASY